MHITRNSNNLKAINFKHNSFNNSFYPSVISEWNKFHWKIQDSDTLESFKKQILNIIRPGQNSTFKLHNPLGTKLLTRLRVGLSHLKEHKFKHDFQDSIDPLCSRGNSIESTFYVFLHCSN